MPQMILLSLLSLHFVLPSLATPSSDPNLSPRDTYEWPGIIPPVKLMGKAYQGTITGYGKGGCNDPTKIGKCGFLGSGTSPQAAFSAGFNEPPEPGVCGSCWILTAPKKLCYDTKPPHICPGPDDVDTRSQSGLIVLVTNTCAPDTNPDDGNTIRQCNQENGSKDGLGSDTVVDLCMDTDAAQAWWNSTTNAGLNVATVQQVDCSSWPGQMGPQASWLNGGYKGCPGCVAPAQNSRVQAVPQSVQAPVLAMNNGDEVIVEDEEATS
ncbi:uncharacterized protein KY384_007333 [Bacidia gigantensis]|uniref:uncharacterized protein n=1 Tax=Bacidia gigantensis TaxID=2732470 RepID=UPI001D051038|nr:uncharacterized protein KY384_007333 [Bacidia gigantensis]KAG8528415.1 hypothetical protein KY384_007333 [Bacidia gigantensis]